MSELPGLTEEQVDALEALGKAFGIDASECFLHNVRDQEHVWERFGYAHWIRRHVRETTVSFQQLKHAMTLPEGPSN
jgi:hypothetical protein